MTVALADVSSTNFDPFAGPVIVATAPSTAPQREIWTACALGDDASLAFNESVTVRLRGVLDPQALRAALSELVQRHEALRTTLSGDGLTLCVGSPEPAALTEHDFSALEPQAALDKVVALAGAEVSLPFDLAKGPLFRVHLARLPGPAAADHALVFTAHHIVCDGWSTAVLMHDLATLYNARSKGFGAELPPAESLSAYASSQAERPAAARLADEDYWLKQFTGEIPILDLPGDRPRPARKTYAAGREDAVLEPELVAAVRKAGAKARSSLFATLLAGFKALVFRLTGQEDLVVGIPAAGQAVEGHTNLVGHCVNMLPLRSAVRADEPFTQLLGRVRKTLLDAQEHQAFSFGELLTKLPIGRDPSRLPLVSVIFNVDRGMTSEAIGFENIAAELKANPRSHENFELFLNAVEIDGRVELECQYNSDLFDAATIRRWLASYRLLLESIAQAPDTTLAGLAVLTDADRLQLSAWNATDAAFQRQACVHHLVEERARLAPQRVACEFGEQALTYAELDAQANRLARLLRERGVARGSLVGLCLERGLPLLVGLLAIHKAGGAYVPLDPGYPKERLAHMVQDAAMQVLVTDSTLERELELSVPAVVCVDKEQAVLAASSAEPLPQDERAASPESVAYVIYTSGSTGKPKGVLVPHRAVVNLLNSVSKRPGLTDSDVVLAITTLSFDIAVSEVWLPLVVGAKIVLVTRETAADGAQLKDVCERRKVTFIDATPATYRLLLAAGWRGSPSLKLVCTGEAMPKDLMLELPRCAGSVWNGYGPTETTVWSTFWQVPAKPTRVLIGQPVDNTRIHVLDAQRRQVPIGVTGELFIAGDGVSLGYFNRPELTADRFVPDPFDAAGALMYRTGDLGRWLSSGDLECLGRNDNQVKLRGFRIELGEIEDALSRHEAIAEAAVILREDRPGDARLVGYVVPRGAVTPAPAELRAHLQRTLPDYMTPAIYVSLPRMPLTPSGKVDRRALPAPEGGAESSGADFVPPRTPTEQLLAELWATALNVARVSVNDDFFALGGHSLLASQILARLRADHGIELSFRRFFEAPSVARLAALIDGAPAAPRSTPALAIVRRPAGTQAPLSLGQERLWLLEEMHPAQRLVHNLPAAWRLNGPIDPALLQAALDRIAVRHETLRSTVELRGNQAVQHVADRVSLPIEQIDLRELPSERREPAMFEQIRELTSRQFDLTSLPLFRSALFRLGDEQYVYFTVRHNIIWDGWSFDIFLAELCATYAALQQGSEPSVKELPVSYGDYAIWQREWVKSGELARQIQFWQERLAGPIPDLSLPFDRPRPAQTQHAGANTALAISRSDADALNAVAQRAGTTLFNVLFAAYAIVLQRYSGQDEVVVGTPVRARNLPEVENLIGPFINAIVLRVKLSPRESFLDYLARVKELTLDSFSNQDMPLELLGSRPPLVRAFFSFQDAKQRSTTLGAARVSQIDVEPPAAANDLMLWLMDRPHELLAVANFSTELFDTSTIQRMLRSFVTLLQDIATNPRRAIGELTILAAEDRAALERVSEARPLPSPEGVAYGAFSKRLAAAPNDVAFVGREERSTFAELNERALATAQLVSAKVEVGTCVGIVLPPGVALASAALGVLLAGCSVLCVDPGAPEAYRARLLEAGKPGLLIVPDAQAAAGSSVPQLAWAEVKTAVGSASGNPRGGRPAATAWQHISFGHDGSAVVGRVTHAELAARLEAVCALVEPGSNELLVLCDPLAESLPLTLLLGAALGVPTQLVGSEAELEAALIVPQSSELERSVLTPAALLAASLPPTSAALKRSRVLVFGGLSSELLQVLTSKAKQVVTLQASAPPASLLFGATVEEPRDAKLLGRALGGSSVTVLDASGAAIPVGAVGELCADGDEALAIGLRGRMRADGRLELAGEASDWAVLDGQRFSPAEVARTLEVHPAVKRAAVRVAREQGSDRLVAYFVANHGCDFTDTELRAHVRAALPEPMVPQLFIELPSLPVLADGAVDVSKLPAPFGSGGGHEYVAPRNESERVLAELYAQALGLERVSVYDNFFDLGGHSLLCFSMLEKLEKRVGKRLGPRTVLLGSLEQVAAELTAALGTAAPRAAAASSPAAPPPAASVTERVFKKLTGLLRR
ncbi:MAG TPA: amino acid adenylation domain-containing protein [Polyangiaceae bacterium]|nr:amino acid adenylation domain-containing protein [Polyangiaceae bacterium]